MSVELRLSGKD